MADTVRDPSTGRFVRGKQLDQYPQWLQLPRITESAAGTFAEGVQTQSPVIPQSNKVMEILGVQFEMDSSGVQAVSADLQADMMYQITSSSQSEIISFEDPALIDKVKQELAIIRNDATGVGMVSEQSSIWHNFATAGHGPLTAARKFFLGVRGNSALAAIGFDARILYRLVQVTEAELLGLIQEQLGV